MAKKRSNVNILPNYYNDELEKMIPYTSHLFNERGDCEKAVQNQTGFFADYLAILEAFKPCSHPQCPCILTYNDIYRRLVLIDSLYSTNVVRMRKFGIKHIAQEIWQLCNNNQGVYSDVVLVNKVCYYLSCVRQGNGYTNSIHSLITQAQYGYVNAVKQSAPSLISKYLYFLLQANSPKGADGFPIYDSIVAKYAPRLASKLGLPRHTKIQTDIVQYITLLYDIADCLSAQNINLWTKNNPCITRFALLDYFLWHVGKSQDKSYSLLLTEGEYINFISKNLLPQRIINWQNINI